MFKVIDCASDVGRFATELKASGIDTVIRYYNHRNVNHPTKRLEPSEAKQLVVAGLHIAVVFQQRGGAGGHLSDLTKKTGRRDALRALQLAKKLGQPDGSAIYFAVDHDFWRSGDLEQIKAYFKAVSETIKGQYRIGTYGSGTVGRTVRDAGYAQLIWLAAARGWSGTSEMLGTNQWALYQIYPAKHWTNGTGSFTYDGNHASPAWRDFGQFSVSAAAPDYEASILNGETIPKVHLLEVIARPGLNVRGGPSVDFSVEQTLPNGTLVSGLRCEGKWVQVDIDGDGLSDGYMYSDFLRTVVGGQPAPMATTATPYGVAQTELALDIREVPNAGNNPRIVMYHESTGAVGERANDAVAWCSSFVNYCVEQAGFIGTNSQAAQSWKDWGSDATDKPQPGDIAVFSRGSVKWQGHVGFWVSEEAGNISVLGGNQSDRVRIQRYPKDGKLGNVSYKLLAVRRP